MPLLVVAGVVDAGAAGRVPSVSLLDEFGTDASWGDPLGCVTHATSGWLRREFPSD